MRTMQRIMPSCLLLALSLPLVVDARQAPSPSKAAFEVVSIKPMAPGAFPAAVGDLPATYRGRIFRMQNASIAGLVAGAFRSPDRTIEQSRVFGVPDELATTRFEIVATLSTDIGLIELGPHVPALMRAVLEDRFKLQAHIESRPFPVFTLVRARADGRLGSQIHPSSLDCDALLRDELAKGAASPDAKIDPSGCRMSRTAGTISAAGMTMSSLAGNLRVPAGRDVVDRTGIPGRFDLELRWAPEGLAAAANGVSDAPTLFTALQEQLGLKLEVGQAPMDVVVIDHIERPTPN
jgi:uncharacterized protein (TIGR03435 family)